jgi:hypothetical protein
MKKIISLLLVVLCTLAILGISKAYASFDPNSTVCNQAAAAGAHSDFCNPPSASTDPFGPNGIVKKVIDIFSVVVGIVSVIMIMVGGFEYVTSGGDSQKTSRAKDTIVFAVVGIAIVAVAQVIVVFVIGNLGS